MTSTFTYIKSKWLAIDPAWRFSISIYLAARAALSVWAFIVSALFPLAVTNLDLHGQAIVAAFDLHTSGRAVFSRVFEGKELFFRSASPNLVDIETNSLWNLDGHAISGAMSGATLRSSAYSVEDIFPYRGVNPSQNILLAVWQRFDANWYLKIAQNGYAADGSTVYFPLYPLLIRTLGVLMLGWNLLAATIISNLALVGVLYLFYQISSDLVGKEASKRALVFFALFPTAFFLFAPYTESIFLLSSLASLREGIREHRGRAGIFGGFGALTRLQGVLLILPLSYLFVRSLQRHGNITSNIQVASLKNGWLKGLVGLLLIPIATFSFLLFTNLSLFTAYESQLYARFVFPWDNLYAAIALLASAHSSVINDLNFIFTLLFAVMVAAVWFNLPREFGLYSLAMFLVPLFRITTEQPLVSMLRYILVIFPVFILLGKWAQSAWLARAIVYLSLPLQLYLSAQFILWGWVG